MIYIARRVARLDLSDSRLRMIQAFGERDSSRLGERTPALAARYWQTDLHLKSPPICLQLSARYNQWTDRDPDVHQYSCAYRRPNTKPTTTYASVKLAHQRSSLSWEALLTRQQRRAWPSQSTADTSAHTRFREVSRRVDSRWCQDSVTPADRLGDQPLESIATRRLRNLR